MVLTFIGRSAEDPSSKDEHTHLTMLSQTLVDMVDQVVFVQLIFNDSYFGEEIKTQKI